MIKKSLIILIVVSLTYLIYSENNDPVVVKSVKGDAYIREGISENWIKLNSGDNLNLEDTIVSGKGSEVVLELNNNKRFVISEEVYLDVADIRNIPESIILMMMTKEEIEKIPRRKNNELINANVSVIHGKMLPDFSTERENEKTLLRYKINGIISLIDNGFKSSAIVKFRELEDEIIDNEQFIPVSLKVADILVEKNFKGNAKRIYKNIIDKFPSSNYIDICKKRLNDLIEN